MSGGGGGKAIAYLIENATSQQGTVKVNSTPIVIRSLTGVCPQCFRDLTLVAGTIGDYAAVVVHKDSPINSMDDLLAAYKADPRDTAIGGGSVPGGMDHLVAAMVMEAAGEDLTGEGASLSPGKRNPQSAPFNNVAQVASGEALEVKIVVPLDGRIPPHMFMRLCEANHDSVKREAVGW